MGALSSESAEDFLKGVIITKRCLREPIPEIYQASFYLDEAVCAHLDRRPDLAKDLIRSADMRIIRDWTESLWGKGTKKYQVVSELSPELPEKERDPKRMPTEAEEVQLRNRDHYHCRFCGIPVIRKEVREQIRKHYPEVLPWGTTNQSQHAAFQAMWLQYDHLSPHAKGGKTVEENMVITCAPCNFARMNCTLEEVGLIDPRTREAVRSSWDGLERFR